MLWFRAPEKVYFKKGCLPVALRRAEGRSMGKKRAFIVTDSFLYHNPAITKPITDKLDEHGHHPHHASVDVAPDPTLACCQGRRGADARLRAGLHHRHRRRFRNGRRQDHVGDVRAPRKWTSWTWQCASWISASACTPSPRWVTKAYFIAIPTSAGTGSEVTPFAVITDEDDRREVSAGGLRAAAQHGDRRRRHHDDRAQGPDLRLRYRCADPRAGGLRLHAWRPTTPTAWRCRRLKLIFEYLPARLRQRPRRRRWPARRWPTPPRMAGMAFANAFLGVCHSMAHKLGAFHHLPHGMANALLICSWSSATTAAEVPDQDGHLPAVRLSAHHSAATPKSREFLRLQAVRMTTRRWRT